MILSDIDVNFKYAMLHFYKKLILNDADEDAVLFWGYIYIGDDTFEYNWSHYNI